jgi:hypothetical protein
MWVKKYITSGNHGWKPLFENALNLSYLDPKLIFFCNFDINQWNVNPLLSSFYQQVLTEWFKSSNSSTFDKDQILWYNRNIQVQKQSVFYRDFLHVGIKFISDLYEGNSIIPFTLLKNKGLNNSQYMKWRGLLSSIAKNVPKASINTEINSTFLETLDIETLTYNNHHMKVLTSKRAYDHILTIQYGKEVNIPRITKYTNFNNTDWSIWYNTAQTIPIDTKTREFLFKFLHDILANNYWLHKWKLADTDQCTFCKTSRETTLHLFWHCEFSQSFWTDFNLLYAEQIDTVVDLHTVVCGSQNPLICTLISVAKRYIYECRFKEKKPNIRIYKYKVNFVKNTEFEIAKQNDTVLKHCEKWDLLNASFRL